MEREKLENRGRGRKRRMQSVKDITAGEEVGVMERLEGEHAGEEGKRSGLSEGGKVKGKD